MHILGMRVRFAYYGLSCSHGIVQNQIQTANWVRSLCDGKDSCSGLVSVSVIGDPYYGCHKDFLIVAECSYGRIVAAHVPYEAHGRKFTLNCYTNPCLLYTSPSPRDATLSRMPSSA